MCLQLRNTVDCYPRHEAQKNDKDWTVQKRLLSARRASQMAVYDNEIKRWVEVDVPYLHLSSSEVIVTITLPLSTIPVSVFQMARREPAGNAGIDIIVIIKLSPALV
ncbi:hypothetical protein J6590_054357 [Homalodisca vitripennis]|nr:hypothetical protein J6590_054357 [Homalodisca vitripennis]